MGLRTMPVRCLRRIAARIRTSAMRSKPQAVQPARNVTAVAVAAAAGCLIKDRKGCISVGHVTDSGVLRSGLESSATGAGWRVGTRAASLLGGAYAMQGARRREEEVGSRASSGRDVPERESEGRGERASGNAGRAMGVGAIVVSDGKMPVAAEKTDPRRFVTAAPSERPRFSKLKPKQSFYRFIVFGLHVNFRWPGGVHCSAAQPVGGREAVGRPTLATSGALLYGLRNLKKLR